MNRDRPENRNLIHERLRQYRLEQGMSQEQLAAAVRKLHLPMSRQTVSKIERNIRYVLDYEVFGFCWVLSVLPAELMCLEETAD